MRIDTQHRSRVKIRKGLDQERERTMLFVFLTLVAVL